MSDDNVPVLPIKKAISYILASANLQVNGHDMAIPYYKGPPGIGKSRYLENECKKLNYGLVSFHFALIPIEEIGGLPVFKKITCNGEEITGSEWSLPDIMTKIYEMSAKYKTVIVFLDDFHMSSPAHLSLGYEMFTERKLRGFKLPDNCAFILAGNDSVKSGVKQMFGAIINRLAIYTVKPDFDQWLADYAIPNNVNSKVITFLKNKINSVYFLGEESTNDPWPSPRAWSRFSVMLNNMEEYIPNISNEEILYIAYGHVGKHAASEFTAYYNIYSKTEMDKIFDKKKKIEIPTSSSDLYIYAMAASNEYISRILDPNGKKAETIDTITDIIIECGKTNVEIIVALLKNIVDYGTFLSTEKKSSVYVNDIFKKIGARSPELHARVTKTLSNIVGAVQ